MVQFFIWCRCCLVGSEFCGFQLECSGAVIESEPRRGKRRTSRGCFMEQGSGDALLKNITSIHAICL
uniref:Uncharacterized protein n=1 Tax=Physcomitrium patens TaxID=3218 RepID=A0A2K1JI30_PHYPA|nr:hypothetical protein PHYPA_018608 [Physcomitrium patens]